MSVPRFFFGAMSPYSWFTAERVEAVVGEVAWRPLFAGGLFVAAGRTSWGVTEERRAKMADCDARAERHGLGSIDWPDPWPTNDVRIARTLLLAERAGKGREASLAAMRLCFRDGVDLGGRAACLEVARRVGLDVAAIDAGLDGDEVKSALRARNDEAVALGVFGVPTVEVGGELFWGDDRLEEAATATASAA